MNIVENDEISINNELWVFLNTQLTKDEIKQLISDAIGENELPMPMSNISLEDSITSFNTMVDDTPDIVKGEWFSKYDYKYPLSPMYFSSNRAGNNSSNFYHQRSRWHCDSINSPSPYRSWNIERFRLTLLNALWSLKFDKINNRNLRTAIGLRKYIAAQFRPSSAKQIYEHFNAVDILDFSSGWGDRLSGFMAANGTRSYVGIDPNTRVHEGYIQQINQFMPSTKMATFYDSPAEDFDFDRLGMFDFIFTSPPYFNIERYTQDDKQSFKRYRKLEDWLELFLYTVLKKAWTKLKEGGTMVINISDVYSNHRINNICDPMNDFIATLPNSEYVGGYGYQMAKRPNSKTTNKDGVFGEPMWVWKKQYKSPIDEL